MELLPVTQKERLAGLRRFDSTLPCDLEAEPSCTKNTRARQLCVPDVDALDNDTYLLRAANTNRVLLTAEYGQIIVV